MREEVIALFRELADVTPAEREEYYASRQIPASIRGEVESLLRFDQASGSLTGDIAAAAADVLKSQSELSEKTVWGPWRLVRPLGHGGMGTVYLAERADGEVEQRVAIKVVRAGTDGPAFQDRFLRERRILASLNHPGIARLIDAGHTGDGQPYLAMEYVDGVPLDEYCANLDLRSVLKLFLHVCEAVSFAHRNLVIHRDLKPSNILIDAAGQPRLLDFGIARILDDTENTRTLVRVLTPDYASPEQIRGDAHGTPTDVYSLGAVLSRLLTGGRANTEVRRDVDSIVRRAMRIEPEERYPSVDAFAEDVRAFLENRPVRARAGSGWYYTRKFLRRYWVPVTAAAVALVSLSAGLYVANRERAIAESRFLQVRQLANKVFDIDKAIRNTPGTTAARQLIVATSLEYLERVGAEARGDKDLTLDIGGAYVQLAHVQGVPVNSNLGQFAQADESLRRADSLVNSILKSDPANRRALLTLATIAHDRMVLAGVQGRHEEALQLARAAADTMARLRAAGALDENAVREVAFMYSNVAVTFDESHRFEETMRYARQSIDVAQRQKGTGGQQSLAWGILADALRQSGDLDGALAAVRRSRELQEQLANTGLTWSRANLILALWREGSILGEDGDISLNRTAEALPVLQRALNMADELAKNDPGDTSHHQLVGEVARRVGDLLRRSDAEAALAAYDLGITRLREAKNSNIATRRTEAALLASSSYALHALRRDEEAGRRTEAAFHLLRANKDPAVRIEPGSEVDLALRATADGYAASGDLPKAAAAYAELLGKLAASDADLRAELRTATYVSNAWAAAAPIFRRAGQKGQAEHCDEQRRRVWQDWERKLPNNGFVRREVDAAQKIEVQ